MAKTKQPKNPKTNRASDRKTRLFHLVERIGQMMLALRELRNDPELIAVLRGSDLDEFSDTPGVLWQVASSIVYEIYS